MNNPTNVMSFPIYSETAGNEFSFIWRKIAATFEFKQYKIKPMDPNLVFVHDNPATSTYITIAGQIQLFNGIYAVKDQQQHNRFFIGFDSLICNTDYNITGIIVYFDLDGISQIKQVLNRVVYNYDIRNGLPNIYLYNQSLIFTVRHRDTCNLILGITLLDYDDFVINVGHFYTDITMSRNKNSYSKPRFMFIKDLSNNIHVFDLGSLKMADIIVNTNGNGTITNGNNNFYSLFFSANTGSKKQKSLVLNHYSCTCENELSSLISDIIINSEPEYYGDRYKDNCIMCDRLTYVAECTEKEEFGFSHLGLGHSYCDECKVRYSKTDKKWQCCKLDANAHFCSGEVWQNQPCMKEHSVTMTTKIVRTFEKFAKYPYKQSIYIEKTRI